MKLNGFAGLAFAVMLAVTAPCSGQEKLEKIYVGVAGLSGALAHAFIPKDTGLYEKYGLDVDLEPVTHGVPIDEAESVKIGGVTWRILLVPGHCPGSLCFFREEDRVVYAGDTIFAGSIGRTDLPFGDHELLLRGIRDKLFPLGDDVRVLPGHGPGTTIGVERKSNPFLN